MKKVICLIMAACLLLSSVSLAFADAINLTKIKTRENFSYNDSANSSWVYYQYAETELADGTYVEFLVADWGNNTEATGYPEFRVFAATKANEDIIVQSGTFMIDGNMFDLTFDELKLDSSHGACFYMTSDAVPFMKSLAMAKSVSAVLRHAGGTISVSFNANEIAPIGQFMYDLLSIDFLDHVASSEAQYESWYKEKTPILSYVFNEVDLAERTSDEQVPVQTQSQPAGDEWVGHTLSDLGVDFYLPANFTVYTRGMSASDPVVQASGMTPAQIDQALVDGNYYLEATQDDFESEVFVTMIGSTINDFNTWSDSGLLSMSSLWTASYQSYGIEILDTDIFTCNNVKYIRMHEKQTANGAVMYKMQYYTTTNYQAINFVYISNYDDVTESEKAFMESVVEHAVFGTEAALSDIGAFAEDPSNFTYELLADGTASITGYNGLTGTLAIPSVIDGHTVSNIAVMEKSSFVANIFIPDSVTSIEDNPFMNLSSLKTVNVSDSHPKFAAIDGVLYSKDTHDLICYPAKHAGDEFAVPSHVTRIKANAFHNNYDLAQLTLPDGLIEIDDYAFYGLSSVPTITIPSTVTTIGVNPFVWMSSLEEILVAPGNKTFTVQQGALYNRKTNVLIAFPRKYVTSSFAFREGVVEIGEHAFANVSAKLTITFPDSIRTIGDDAFYSCKNMTFTNFPIAIEHLGSMAFSSSGIESATIPGTIKTFDRSCFNSAALKTIEICPGVSEIPLGAFVGCDGLTEVTIPETVVTIGNFAFRSCSNLKSVNIPASVRSIGENVFENDTQLTVKVVKGSTGETYCKQNNIPYQYYESDVATASTLREYTLSDGPFTVTLDATKYNIVTTGMATSDPAVVRSGIGADMFETYMSLNGKSLIMTDINDKVPAAKFDISIKIKDKKYADVDLRKCSTADANMMLDMIYTSFSGSATGKEIVKINGVPYLKFSWMNDTQLRYATIVGGDMIYIWATRDDGKVTDDDAALLLQVVESVKFPD